MLHKSIKRYIKKVAKHHNKDAQIHCNKVSRYVNQLNHHIAGHIELSDKRIEILLDELVGFYTITLDTTLDIGTHIVRARKFEELNSEKPYYTTTEKLSCIPKHLSHLSSRGRLNKEGEVIFYGCISNKNDEGFNVAFSEVRALEGETLNLLKSKLVKELKVTYIGVFDYYKRGIAPPFKVHPHFRLAYNYQKKMFDEYLMVAHQICDAFFSDILRRKGNDRLYQVTSVLASLFLEGNRIDAIFYASVQAETSPILAIKPSVIGEKLKHIDAVSVFINRNYGYAVYNASITHKGKVIGEKIIWEKMENGN